MDAVTPLLAELVRIDSVNPALVPGGAGEGEIGRFVASWLERAGLAVELYEVAPGRPNVVATAPGSGGGRSLMLYAHTDTVGVAGMDHPHDPRIDGQRLFGRGALDMKGSLAACMVAAAELRRRNLRGDVVLAAVADEEHASIGAERLVARCQTDAAIVSEPTGLRVCVAHKGFAWLEIETAGRAAHGSRPDLGVDAITGMGHVLVGLEELDRTLRARPGHPLLGTGSLHASLIEGGQELSSYPARCHLSVERRTIPGETAELVKAEIGAVLDRAAADRGSTSVEVMLHRPPFEVPEHEPIVRLTRESVATVVGSREPVVGASGWMDSALLAAAGIPTVIFGPSGEGAHAALEWVDLRDVERCAEVYVAVARAFCD
jgi:acetylornithine deacetylase